MLKLGINGNVSNEDYHADREYVSSSGLKKMLYNPKSFYEEYVLGEEGEVLSGAALDFGSYVHCAILEPHLLDVEFAVYEGVYRRGIKWDEFQKEHEGKILITKSQYDKAQTLIKSFSTTNVLIGKQGRDKEVPVTSFYTGGYPEQTLCGEINGIKVKVRADYIKEFEDFASINDIKTTGEYIGTAKAAERVCATWGYDLSAALYVDMFSQHLGKPVDWFFTFLSKKNSECKMYKASEQMLEKGREKYMMAIEALKKARETGVYYINKIESIDSIEL